MLLAFPACSEDRPEGTSADSAADLRGVDTSDHPDADQADSARAHDSLQPDQGPEDLGGIDPSIGQTRIAKWRFDRKVPLTVNFDDSTPNQVKYAVPEMAAVGLQGTFFINPGTTMYKSQQASWENDTVRLGQEVANHTMNHRGAASYAEAETEIGDAATYIWSLYPPQRSKLIAFNRGGGTNWNISDAQYQQLLDKYSCIERKYSTGIKQGQKATVIINYIKQNFQSDHWKKGNIHFHGICLDSDKVNCLCPTVGSSKNCREYGNGANHGAIQLSELKKTIAALATDPYFKSTVWIAGYIAVHKYEHTRDNSAVSLIASNPSRVVLQLTTTLDTALYDEGLTLVTAVPLSWTSCVVRQGSSSKAYQAKGGQVVFEAKPGADLIVVEQKP